MKFGISQFLAGIWLMAANGTNKVTLKAPATVATDFALTVPDALPPSTLALTVDTSGNMSYAELGSGGSVTSVALSLPNIFSVTGSPITTSGTLAASLASQTQKTFLAAPSGADGTPSFRAIAWADVSALGGTTGTSFALGNDSRLHTQNTDTGTTQTTFQINSSAGGPLLKNNGGTLEVRNSTDTAYAPIVVGNVIIKGTTTTIESETLAIGDSLIVLNQEYTGSTPTENGGIEIERGTLANASFIWDESSDRWMAGTAGSEIPVSRTYRNTFTNANLTAGVLTVTHNLAQQYCTVQVFDNNNKQVIADDVTLTSSSVCTIDLTSFGTLTGTWKVVVVG